MTIVSACMEEAKPLNLGGKIAFLARSRKARKTALWLFFIIILLIIYSSDALMIEIPQSYFNRLNQATGMDFNPVWEKITGAMFRLADNINVFRIKKNF